MMINSAQPSFAADFAIVMVNYKTLALTKISLSLLKRHLDAGAIPKNTQVWVVDNDSQDESTAYLQSLDWIHLIERKVVGKEEGFAAHGIALDLVLPKIYCQYLFLMHTDTFIYRPDVFGMLLTQMQTNAKNVAVGCLEQLNRGYLRSAWRLTSRFCKYHYRRNMLRFGINAREPKPYKEQYIKSFFALWNVEWMRQNQQTFFMGNRIPGYTLQDKVLEKAYKIKHISPMTLFKYLDHAEAGTVGLVAGYDDMNRRIKRKLELLKKYQ
jgi:GT2 family glycosyltransferase